MAAHAQLHVALSNWSLWVNRGERLFPMDELDLAGVDLRPPKDQYEPEASEEPLNEAELHDYPKLLNFVAETLRAALDLYEMTIKLYRQYPEAPEDDTAEGAEPVAS